MEQQLAEIDINRKSSFAVLSILMNTRLEKANVQLPEVTIKDSLENIRPEYKLFDLQSQQVENNKSLLSTQLMPKISAFGEAGYGRPGLNMLSDNFAAYYLVGLTFKWNFFDWNKNSHDRQVLEVQKI